MTQVVLVGKDWTARALLRAQLIEEGLGVEAFEKVSDALARLEGSAVSPALLLADISASDDPRAELDQLAPQAQTLPVWIIAARNLIAASHLGGRGFEVVLFRPVDLGQLVERIKQRLKG